MKRLPSQPRSVETGLLSTINNMMGQNQNRLSSQLHGVEIGFLSTISNMMGQNQNSLFYNKQFPFFAIIWFVHRDLNYVPVVFDKSKY